MDRGIDRWGNRQMMRGRRREGRMIDGGGGGGGRQRQMTVEFGEGEGRWGPVAAAQSQAKPAGMPQMFTEHTSAYDVGKNDPNRYRPR